MLSPWESLVNKVGLEAAKAEMKRRRGLVKHPGFSSMSKEKLKEIQAKAMEARRAKDKDRQSRPVIQPVDKDS